MKNIAVAKYYLSERDILGETIYLGIDSNSVKYRKVSKNNKIIKFVFAGSLGRQYDLDSLYEVIKRLNRNEYTFTIDIAGYGNLPENLSMSNVKFHGVLNRDQLTELLLSNHCGLNLIASGSHIALPNKVAEYFFHGLSIINGSSGELEELVENNNLGTNYQPGDVDSLYDAFIVEIKKHQNAEYTEEEINRFAIHHFSRSNIYPKLLTILNAAYEDLELRL
ncbi:glycosyltransferase [Deinococcus aerophilus]|uniref:Glycosyl transferase family 1 domain-containing protein n=1 Tax=Deinococcus aerophilus TaxID=522488 RepID=A0ABQ2GVV9_9DEIO|nr:glycosyltransferase [Deinococcus aerophilus]GGM13475.1 hypothetical protein GCM10010841_22600 [Deinococcus aerophilus]